MMKIEVSGNSIQMHFDVKSLSLVQKFMIQHGANMILPGQESVGLRQGFLQTLFQPRPCYPNPLPRTKMSLPEPNKMLKYLMLKGSKESSSVFGARKIPIYTHFFTLYCRFKKHFFRKYRKNISTPYTQIFIFISFSGNNFSEKSRRYS